ncbi:hypothetical protein ANO14919_138570 [Xylariales sp. No.14919]|nr:hypothetical protein ANO14919_138570 [Xylariales sp. No.14919]
MPLAPVVLADLGLLSTLPLELVLVVIEYLDVRGAARFTHVNRQAQFLLWSDKDYQLLRYCLFRQLSKYKRKFHQSKRLSFLQDANYQTLADAMLNPTCTACSRVSYALDLMLDVSTGQTLCWPCSASDIEYIPILADHVRMDCEEVKNTIPYRLPEGQLICMSTAPSRPQRTTSHYVPSITTLCLRSNHVTLSFSAE